MFGRNRGDSNPSSNSSPAANFAGGLVNKLPFNSNNTHQHKQTSNMSTPSRTFTVGNCPNNSYALANVVSVNPSDYADGSYISINDFFVFSTKHSRDTASGEIGMNGTQRFWGEFSVGQSVNVKPYDITNGGRDNTYAGTVNVEISFKMKNRATTIVYDQDELSKHFIKCFNTQILTPSQMLLFEFKGVIFEIRVQSIQPVDINNIEKALAVSTSVETKATLVPQTDINFFKGRDGLVQLKASVTRPRTDAIIRPDFKFEDMGVGGLDKEFSQIFRRAFASRIMPPGLIEKLGVKHVKGMLLYGPPGTGKTLIARKIGQMLNANEPKIVNGPEILSKYVGSSEENIRNLFKDAEAEYKSKGDESSLHIIIFDELDSVFKQRGSRGDGTGVADNVVNQLLAKMDGVDQLNNILVIGMTNRKDLIDNALLRPGRFEVQVEISLPDEDGRVQIFEIQTKNLKQSKSLAADVSLKELASMTKNFSGAEIEGLVRAATSFAVNSVVNIGEGKTKYNAKDLEAMKVTREHFLKALTEITPAFGVSEDDMKGCLEGGLYKFDHTTDQILEDLSAYARSVKDGSESNRLVSLLLHGPDGSGKTALAAAAALASEFPLVRMLYSNQMAGMGESAKMNYIDNVFRDCYKSPLSVLVVDSVETIVGWMPVGPRFSNEVTQLLKVKITAKPPKGHRLLIISTTSRYSVLQQMDLLSCFDRDIGVPNITSFKALNTLIAQTGFFDQQACAQIMDQLARVQPNLNISVKSVLTSMETARFKKDPVNDLVDLIATGSHI
ncbi:hypothetical protein WICPIJ_003562 [Wickerhamomyces pijperi]|uniref:Vesicular-fusion protein SEC18 n=1 Tax=Wickerhamomyces pijperi TaxID=599730 RepID=A0A9P8Q7J7_WICPI|nr:hypothetical protein WICPIJ_003562 [Wickerhamomyces pijperi]